MLEKPFKPTIQVTFFGTYGIVGLVLAAIVHVGSFGAMVLPSNSGVFMLMHVGIFPLFFAFVLRAREWQQPGSSWMRGQNLVPPRELLAYVPTWAIVVVAALFVYTFVNFALATGLLSGTVSTSGTRILSDAQTARAFSGHWMLFYAMPAVFFSFVPSDARPSHNRDAAE